MAAQRGADRGRRDPGTKAEQLALDALVAPGRVLPGQSHDQLLDLLVQRWPAHFPARVGPRPGDQPPMPPQQRLRPDEEARPAGPRENTAEHGQQRPIGRLQPGARGLAVQHGQLMAEHQDLQVLGGVAAGQQHQQLDGAAQGQVGESRQHAAGLRASQRGRHTTAPRTVRTASSRALSEFAHPTR
jgi:hypothetical protein